VFTDIENKCFVLCNIADLFHDQTATLHYNSSRKCKKHSTHPIGHMYIAYFNYIAYFIIVLTFSLGLE